MAVPRLAVKGKQAAGVLALALAMGETRSRGRRPPVRGLEPRRRVVRGLPVEVPAGELFSLWDKVLDTMIFIFLRRCVLFV